MSGINCPRHRNLHIYVELFNIKRFGQKFCPLKDHLFNLTQFFTQPAKHTLFFGREHAEFFGNRRHVARKNIFNQRFSRCREVDDGNTTIERRSLAPHQAMLFKIIDHHGSVATAP